MWVRTVAFIGRLIRRHAGVLGLSALVGSCPYTVPEWLPHILEELAGHLHDPQPIPVSYSTPGPTLRPYTFLRLTCIHHIHATCPGSCVAHPCWSCYHYFECVYMCTYTTLPKTASLPSPFPPSLSVVYSEESNERVQANSLRQLERSQAKVHRRPASYSE